jgi:hypothetical protein
MAEQGNPRGLADTRIPITAYWASLERSAPEQPDRWDRVELAGIGHWWRPTEGHPEDIATKLWEQGQLPDGLYRAVFAPRDKRRRLALAAPFELFEDEEGEEEDEEDEDEEGEEEDDETGDGSEPDLPALSGAAPVQQQTLHVTPAPVPAKNGNGRGPVAPIPQKLHVPAPAPRPLVRSRRKPLVPTPFDPPAPRDETALGTFVYLHSLAEAQRDREHQLTLSFVNLMISAVDARATAAIASEQARANSVIAYMRELGSRAMSSDLAPLERQVEDLRAQLADAEHTAEEDASMVRAQLDQHMAAMAQKPEGPEALAQWIGGFLQSPAGAAVAKGIQRLFAGGGDGDMGPRVLDPLEP